MYLVVTVGFILSCKPSVPSQFIQPGDMEDLLVDYHISQAMAAQNSKEDDDRPFNETLYFAAVLEKYGYTKAEFDTSLTYYYSRADRFADIYKKVVKRLNESATSMGAAESELTRYSKLTLNSDTVDVWTGRQSAMLMPYPPYNRIDFEQKTDTSYHRGDSFLFIVNNDYIYQNGTRSAEACIVLKYDNDTVVSRAFSLSSSGINQIQIPKQEDRRVKDIRAYIYLAPEKEASSTLKMMIVNNIQLIRMHRKKAEAPKLKNDSLRVGAPDISIDTLKAKDL